MPDVQELAGEERDDLAALLETLTPQQWDAPSLCGRWRVRDVAAHVTSFEGLGARELVAHAVTARLSPARLNDVALAAVGTDSTEELVARLRRHRTPTGVTAGFGGRVALLDGMIHHQDVRRPLGLPRDVPAERLRAALDFALLAPPIRGPLRARGLRLVATDLDWTAGRGPEVTGPGEAILMAVAGRGAAVDDLGGPGRDTLARRTVRLPPRERG